MKFSTRTTYGLRAMIKLAQSWRKDSLSLPTIAKEEGISLAYLERLFAKLKNDNLVVAEKGSAGGYKLLCSPNKITVFNIIKTLEGEITAFHCLREDGKVYCDIKCNCRALIVLNKVQKAIDKTLKSIKLGDLI